MFFSEDSRLNKKLGEQTLVLTSSAVDADACQKSRFIRPRSKHIPRKRGTQVYGEAPEKVYFEGGSNGGRETLKVIQNCPEDYDGAVCLYPVLNYIMKTLKDSRIGLALDKLGEAAWMSREEYAEKVQTTVMEICDSLDGAKDGIISDLQGAYDKRGEVLAALEKKLNPEQLAFLKMMAEPTVLSFPMGYGEITFPGYGVFEGAPAVDANTNWFGTVPGANDNGSISGGNSIIKYAVLGDGDYDMRNFDPEEHVEALQAASRLIDAYTTDLDGFRTRGGKLLLLHGMTDSLVPVESTIQYYKALRARYGEALDEFTRFYAVPGYGHGMSEMFTMDADLIDALDKWVCAGEAPEVIIAADANDQVNHRTRPLYRWPAFPVYNGTGDINDAASFHPEMRLE